jgi:TRAP-type mannitol/chloroaromatic compound transport system substrate-binding protein
MDRRDFLKSGSVLAAGAVTGTGAAVAAGSVVAGSVVTDDLASPAIVASGRDIVLSAPVAMEEMMLGSSAFRLARRIEAATEGRLRVVVQRSDVGALESVTTAQSDIALGTANHNASFHPAFGVFAGLPIGEHLDAPAFNAWYAVGGGAELADDLGRVFGIVSFNAGHSGVSGGLWSERIVETTGDFRGGRVAVAGLARDVVRALGAEALSLTTEEMTAAFKAGTLFAAEPTFQPMEPIAHWSFGPGLNPGGTALAATLRRSFWDQLSISERAVLEGMFAEENRLSLAESFARNAMAAQVTQARRLPIALGLGAGLVHDLSAVSRDVVSSLASFDPTSRRIVDSHRAFRQLLTGADATAVV